MMTCVLLGFARITRIVIPFLKFSCPHDSSSIHTRTISKFYCRSAFDPVLYFLYEKLKKNSRFIFLAIHNFKNIADNSDSNSINNIYTVCGTDP